MNTDAMFLIGEAVVESTIPGAQFHCDLTACKGACCCLEGGRGAPLEDDEVLEIEKAYPAVRQYLAERSVAVIEERGVAEGSPGDFVTPCIDNRDCVYVYYDAEIARCGFERAYSAGLTDWRKPVSCHLFPIRIRRFGGDRLLFEPLEECAPGRQLGAIAGTPLHEFVKEPLIRIFGNVWYREFAALCAGAPPAPER
jgi:hypothetical protein